MNRFSHPYFIMGLIFSCIVAPLVWGQNDANPFRVNADDSVSAASSASGEDQTYSSEIPAAALLTIDGKRLAQQLRNLRRSEASMGAGHPSLGAVRAEIEAVKQRLATFADTSDANASQSQGDMAKSARAMTGDQLRELVVQMSVKIDQLERRIFVLERQLGTIEQ
ncbi:secreted protein [Rhodopirellula maiorica SM1]|uniref:Secreted protein n=1 Tax=Rhodopirellula maiorica SM1 TaxID=1265738 RepID=M5RAL4_9BACT|nr:hypothetical protein [Rhodopirellula maiorica]EMI16538.1 secreted protein [Rhodopirellula maiorica SM1]